MRVDHEQRIQGTCCLGMDGIVLIETSAIFVRFWSFLEKKNPRLELRVLFHKHHYKSMRTFLGGGGEERIFLLWFLLKKEYMGHALYYEKLYFRSKTAWGNDVLITWRPFIPDLLVRWRKLAWGLLMLLFSENAYPNSSHLFPQKEGGKTPLSNSSFKMAPRAWIPCVDPSRTYLVFALCMWICCGLSLMREI